MAMMTALSVPIKSPSISKRDLYNKIMTLVTKSKTKTIKSSSRRKNTTRMILTKLQMKYFPWWPRKRRVFDNQFLSSKTIAMMSKDPNSSNQQMCSMLRYLERKSIYRIMLQQLRQCLRLVTPRASFQMIQHLSNRQILQLISSVSKLFRPRTWSWLITLNFRCQVNLTMTSRF